MSGSCCDAVGARALISSLKECALSLTTLVYVRLPVPSLVVTMLTRQLVL